MKDFSGCYVVRIMKKILKAFIPISIIHLYKKLPIHSLKQYWLKNKSNLRLENELKEMIDFFIKSKSYEYMSNFWNHLTIQNLKQIQEAKVKNYSTTIKTITISTSSKI